MTESFLVHLLSIKLYFNDLSSVKVLRKLKFIFEWISETQQTHACFLLEGTAAFSLLDVSSKLNLKVVFERKFAYISKHHSWKNINEPLSKYEPNARLWWVTYLTSEELPVRHWEEITSNIESNKIQILHNDTYENWETLVAL